MSYNIQGSLAIQVKDGAVKFLFYPANAYLSPDKSYAVLYPVKDHQCNDVENASGIEKEKDYQANLLTLTDGYLEFDYVASTECKGLLSQLALQNKVVALTVDCANKKITGFTYPIPRV